jgi:hypothetical protein
MRRCACLAGLALGFVCTILVSSPAAAQQFRTLPGRPAPVPPPQNTFNNAQSLVGFPTNNNGQTPIGFNVSQIGGAGASGTAGGSVLGSSGTSALGLGGATNPFASPYGAFNTSPFSALSGNPSAASPYTNPYLASPYANPYLASPYANPYMASPYANPYAAYNPYYNPYLGGGFPAGGYSPIYPPMSPAGTFNYNLNYQYLSNPSINPLSNPAFSGPFQPSVFNSMAALNAMGFGNLLQSLPLPNAMPGQAGQQQNNPAFP